MGLESLENRIGSGLSQTNNSELPPSRSWLSLYATELICTGLYLGSVGAMLAYSIGVLNDGQYPRHSSDVAIGPGLLILSLGGIFMAPKVIIDFWDLESGDCE